MKKGLACLVAGSMIVSLAAPAVVGAEQMKQQMVTEQEQASSLLRSPYKDLQGHWAENAVMRMQDMALTKGYTDGTFRPSERISRAEFVVMLDRVFGFAGGPGAASYTDISEKTGTMMRSHEQVDLALFRELMQHICPQLPITRQDAVVMADRAFQLSTGSENKSLGSAFKDDKDVADYARNAMNYFINNKIVNGYNGNLAPASNITRAEAATIMSTLIADIQSKPGTYESNVEGNLIVSSTDVTLKNTTVNGNLLLTEAIGEGTVKLDGVTVTGSVIVKGGGNHSIDIHNSKLNRVVVDKT